MSNQLETIGRRISPPRIPQGISELARVTLEVALEQYGVREDAGRPNRGPKVDEYVRGVSGRFGYLLGASWCGRFAAWCCDTGAARLGAPSILPRDRDLASGAKWLAWGDEAGLLVHASEPGTVAVLANGRGRYHVYFVVDTLLGEDLTVEGNSGDRVDCRARSALAPVGWIKIG